LQRSEDGSALSDEAEIEVRDVIAKEVAADLEWESDEQPLPRGRTSSHSPRAPVTEIRG
jgi:hypothetical protein